jgi:hypothetical protein
MRTWPLVSPHKCRICQSSLEEGVVSGWPLLGDAIMRAFMELGALVPWFALAAVALAGFPAKH